MRILLITLLAVFSMPAILWAQDVPGKTGSDIAQADAQALLNHHNKVRADVGCPPLQWSPQLAEYAQAWANHLASEGCLMEHRPFSGKWAQKYGENIFWGSASSYTPLDASKSWYSEIAKYKYTEVTETNYVSTGHYTQMVWKNTTHVGVGVAVCKGGGIIIVANYNPPGNYVGQKPY
ncbi:MAG: SCP-like extracellular [Bacteroidales bacterium]|nr:SCP-like extracellular [Bacteroidales bacterium]